MQSTLLRYQSEILAALRHAVQQASEASALPGEAGLISYYGQMQYHLGWVDSHFSPVPVNPGKLLRPTLLLLAFEAAGAWNLNDKTSEPQVAAKVAPAGYLRRALPAAVAVELTHNFTLIHDDIEDKDLERHHQPTLWSVWGIQQGVNTGDGMFALARLALWGILDEGVEARIAVRLGALLDQTCLEISEGQYLDISFESRQDIAVSMYMDMIGRKTATLMIEHANLHDQQFLQQVYGQASPVTSEQAEEVLAIFARTETQAYCRAFLAKQCRLAHEALAHVPQHANPVAARALDDMETLVHFVEGTSC